MTKLVKHCVQDIAGFLGIKKNNRMFCPEDCPLLDLGQQENHIFHVTNSNNEEIAACINFLVDLQLVSTNTVLSEQIDFRKRFNKKTKSIFSEIEKVLKFLKNKGLDETFGSNEEQNKVLKSITSRLKNLESSNKDIYEGINELKIKSDSLDEDRIIESVKKATDKQLKLQQNEFSTLKKEITKLISEIKFDPDNPKPTEVRTEENSKQILDLSQKVYPLLESVSRTLEQTTLMIPVLETTLNQVKKRLG